MPYSSTYRLFHVLISQHNHCNYSVYWYYSINWYNVQLSYVLNHETSVATTQCTDITTISWQLLYVLIQRPYQSNNAMHWIITLPWQLLTVLIWRHSWQLLHVLVWCHCHDDHFMHWYDYIIMATIQCILIWQHYHSNLYSIYWYDDTIIETRCFTCKDYQKFRSCEVSFRSKKKVVFNYFP